MNRTKLRFITKLLIFCFLFSIIAPFGLLNKAGAAETTYTAEELAGKAIKFINNEFQAGKEINSYTTYVLSKAGEDLSSSKWTRNYKTLKQENKDLADLLANNNTLISYIIQTQNKNGSFGPYANEYGTKAPLQALARVKEDLTVSSEVYKDVVSAIEDAVEYYNDGYQSGSKSYTADGYGLDYRCVEALADAGVTVNNWVYEGSTLQEEVLNSVQETVYQETTVENSVYVPKLAKELTVLDAVYPNSDNINTLGKLIIEKQNSDGSFGSSIYEHVMVLTALGKVGELSHINQDEALNFINEYKQVHKDSFGYEKGAAWGKDGKKESTLTAQVITALSYFDGVENQDSDVYTAIQDGLTYLNDIQNEDTANIPAKWDSTFSTAETLIALKSLGKTYEEYAGEGSDWTKKSKTKTIAQSLMALSQWNDNERLSKLTNLLVERQISEGEGKGSFENSVYSDMWAYIALGKAGQIGEINTTSAKNYILSKQHDDGSWGESFPNKDGELVYYPDFLSTTQAIRAFTYLPGAAGDEEIQSAIDNGLAYLKGLQKDDGGVYAQFDDPAVDNSEVIITLHKLDKDPKSGEWTKTVDGQEVTPVFYLLNETMNSDESFGTSKNVLGATEALNAYLLEGDEEQTSGDDEQLVPGETRNEYSVEIAVVDKDGGLLYGPGSVDVKESGQFGLTPAGALHATGLGYVKDGMFIKSIAGVANSGMNGWMYKVEGSIPSKSAFDKEVDEGDVIIWWYSTDMDSNGPSWDDLNEDTIFIGKQQETSLIKESVSSEAFESLSKIKDLLGLEEDETELKENQEKIVVVGNDKPMDKASARKMYKDLKENKVELEKEVDPSEETIIKDEKEEVMLDVPKEALDDNTNITVKEIEDESQVQVDEHSLVSSIFEFGPDGTEFKKDVIIALKTALPPLVKPENVYLARYDEDAQKWVPVSAVLDAANGQVLGKINHFSKYAVLINHNKKSFDDVNEESNHWARDVIEILAGNGIINGVGENKFEPVRTITRAEFCSLLVKALDLDEKENVENLSFKDIEKDAWYAGAVAAALEEDLVSGYADNTFRPNKSITRQELAAMTVNAMKAEGLIEVVSEDNINEYLTFEDNDNVAGWAKQAVATAVKENILRGYTGDVLKPQESTNRAEAAAIVYRMLTF